MFLLTSHYEKPEALVASPRKIGAQIKHEGHQLVRLIEVLADGAIRVEDQSARADQALKVTWTFAPECEIKSLGQLAYQVTRGRAQWRVEVLGDDIISCTIGEVVVSRSYGLLEQAPCLHIEARTPLRTEWRRLAPSHS